MKRDSLAQLVRQRCAAAIAKISGADAREVDPQVRPAGDPKFGDYQCNAAMQLARQLCSKPRDVAQQIVEAAGLDDLAETPEIAGPGFINIRLKNEFLAKYLGEIPPLPEGSVTDSEVDAPAAPADRLGMPPVEQPQRVVVDYSSPNIAKQMHVGHLRSTIIGDVITRVLAFEGHELVRQNHVGDWGTQFGMLIAHYADHPLPSGAAHADVLDQIEEDYRAAQERFGHDAAFAAAAREAVGRLQLGDPAARQIWERLCRASRAAFLDAYRRLGVLLADEDVCGESFYNDRLTAVIPAIRARLSGSGGSEHHSGPRIELREDQGAQCLYLYDEQDQPLFKKPDGEELPMIIQKSDGAYLYATTDLAALRYRVGEIPFPSGQRGATRIIYVTDARQKLHFQMLFAAARALGWAGSNVALEHVTFGSVLGENRRPLKTREGRNIKLTALLDEAERRAQELVAQRDAGATADVAEVGAPGGAAEVLTDSEKGLIARRVGIAAVKYADLRNDRNSDYVFSWDKLLALQGNTAPYILYAYARIRSIYRKAAEQVGRTNVYSAEAALVLTEPRERALALRLAQLRETIDAVAAELLPHTLCGYLYDLATDFMRFYEACPVLKAPDRPTQLSRMRLCDLTARSIRVGLNLLGIQVLERM